MGKLPQHSQKGLVDNHVEDFRDISEGQSELPDTIDVYERAKLQSQYDFTTPKYFCTNLKIQHTLQEDVNNTVLGGHENQRHFDK